MVDAAITLFRTNFATLLKISASVLVPVGVIQLVATIAVGPVDMASMLVFDPEATPEELFAPLVPIYAVLGLTGLLAFIGSVLVQGASITALAQVYQGIEPNWVDSLRAALHRWVALVTSTILLTIGSTFGLLFCLVPGVFLFVMWAVSPAALIAEKLGPVAALGRSFRLVRGRFWPVLGAVVLAYLLYLIASQIINTAAFALTIMGTAGTGFMSFIPSVVGSILVSIVATPFLAAMVTIIYFDLRVRKEGYDLELMAADLVPDDRPPPGAPPAHDDPFGLGNPGDR
jgi:hypothetical protein